MFNFFKKKDDNYVLGAPAKGKAVPLSEVNDPTFAEEMLGKGMAVIPSEGKIYAPADGEIGMVFDTLHAVSMTTDFGAEVLIHVGLDTVKMNGDGFTGHVKEHTRKKPPVTVQIQAPREDCMFRFSFLRKNRNCTIAISVRLSLDSLIALFKRLFNIG